jgi:hypothetical protein
MVRPTKLLFVFACALAIGLCPSVLSVPVEAQKAAQVVRGWLRQERLPFPARVHSEIKRTEAAKDKYGNAAYYIVHLNPSGYAIVPADDRVSPVVAFSPTGDFKTNSSSPLTALVAYDLAGRMMNARAKTSTTAVSAKWKSLLAPASLPPDTGGGGSIVAPFDLRVAPLLQTAWNQQLDLTLTKACYNYYTPPGSSGDTNNYPCGCVATAMAQVMFYFRYPSGSVGTGSYTITVNNTPEVVPLLGGPYDWADMPNLPNNPTPAQATAIGALTHDAGVAAQMAYTSTNSQTFIRNAATALVHTFTYANIAFYENDYDGITGTNLLNLINPSLDAHLPVILGIAPDGGHCVVVDGYGYSGGTLYHHLNAGFGGDDDVWYALPSIDTADGNGNFTAVVSCGGDIFPTGSGQIISGRVTDGTGAPIAGATVTATNFTGMYSASTDSNGVYALAHLPADAAYTLTAVSGQATASGTFSTGRSVSNQLPGGDVWGANFVLTSPFVAVPGTGFAARGPVGGPFIPAAQVFTLKNTSSSAITWAVGNTNAWLTVSSTGGSLPAGGTTNLIISLAATATNLGAGQYSGSVWLTNSTLISPQQWLFSLAISTADCPIAVTGYNEDVIVENAAIGGNTLNFAVGFDPDYLFIVPQGPAGFYESGLTATNLYSGPATRGLPPDGLVTSLVDQATTFQFGPYEGNNVLYLTQSAPAGALTLAAPAAYKSLSVLAASTQGDAKGSMVLQFADGSSSTNIPFTAPNYLVTNNASPSAALTNFGLLAMGGFIQYYSLDPVDGTFPFPALYQTTVHLDALGYAGKVITSVNFTVPTGGGVATNLATGIFALSGTEAANNGPYPVTVSVAPPGSGTVTGGGTVFAGSLNTVSAAPNDCYAFANWTQGGVVVSTLPDYTFIAGSGAGLVANFVAPQFGISATTSPEGGGSILGTGFFPSCSTQTITAVAAEDCSFISWTGDVTGTNNPLTLTLLTNINLVANFAYGTNLTLSVTTNNDLGRITPNPNGYAFRKNQVITLTAIPKPGVLFSNWTGSLTTTRNPLAVRLNSSKAVQANFMTNPFLPSRGVYNGLFSATNVPVSEQTCGMLRGLVLGSRGAYSGTLMINGAAHGLSGNFSLGLVATNYIRRPAAQGGPVSVAMTLTPWPMPMITGTVSGTTTQGTTWTASNLLAWQGTNSATSAAYTVIIPPDTNNLASNAIPGGDGFAVATNHHGIVRLTGALADGTPFAQVVEVATSGNVPVYANLYRGRGLLTGWLSLTNTNSPGALNWIRPDSFQSTNTPQISPWLASGFSGNEPTHLFAIEIAQGVSTQTNAFTFSVGNNGVISEVSGPLPLKGAINPRTGEFNVILGTGPEAWSGHGALLQNTGGGAGYFISRTNAGSIYLTR